MLQTQSGPSVWLFHLFSPAVGPKERKKYLPYLVIAWEKQVVQRACAQPRDILNSAAVTAGKSKAKRPRMAWWLPLARSRSGTATLPGLAEDVGHLRADLQEVPFLKDAAYLRSKCEEDAVHY